MVKTFLPCVFPVKFCKAREMGIPLQPLECCCFDRGTKMILRDFSDRDDFKLEVDLYNIYSSIGSLIITLAFHGTVYLIQNE